MTLQNRSVHIIQHARIVALFACAALVFPGCAVEPEPLDSDGEEAAILESELVAAGAEAESDAIPGEAMSASSGGLLAFPNSIDLGPVRPGAFVSAFVSVTNTGSVPIRYWASANVSGFGASPSSDVLWPHQWTTVRIFGRAAAGIRAVNFSFYGQNGEFSPVVLRMNPGDGGPDCDGSCDDDGDSCEPRTCAPYECGYVSDGCGGRLSCRSCECLVGECSSDRSCCSSNSDCSDGVCNMY